MRIKCSNFEEFKRSLDNDRSIIMFGAGAIGQISTPEILNDWGLLERVDCYLDNDRSKWGTYIEVCGRRFEIRSKDYLLECSKKSIILINISRFSEIIKQLDDMPCTKDMECYVMPMMLIHNYCMGRSNGEPVLAEDELIPKKLHYMWLGRKPLPDNLRRCIESWKKFCPDYEIMEWNEDNYDIRKHQYMEEAYDEGAYGFVPDYARIDILYNEGGFYLDTDVEIKRHIDDLRRQHAFCGVEKWQIINFGGMSGAVKGHPMLKEFLNSRKSICFRNPDGSLNKNTCGFYDTRVAIENGYKINGETQCIKGMNIYASDFFHPYDYMSGILNETENTHSVHWFNGGWLDDKMKEENELARDEFLKLYKKAVSEREWR